MEFPASWSPAQLAREEAELRGEVAALDAEIAERRTAQEGPAEARTRADYPVLVELAEKVRAAQDAQKSVADLTRKKDSAEFGVNLAQRRLDDIPGWKFLPRGKAAEALEEAKAKHTALIESHETADETLRAALASAPDPGEWHDILTRADPDEHTRRLAAARREDRDSITTDAQHLESLRRRLGHMHDEQTRRGGMTDAQVRADIDQRRRFRAPDTSRGTDGNLPDPGRTQSGGLEL
jgi:hypothetical protein